MANSRIGVSNVPSKDPYFNYYFRDTRIQEGYSKRELGELVGVSTPAISSYERLRSLPNPFIARRLARVLHKKVSDLFPEQLREYIREIRAERKGCKYDALSNSVPLPKNIERMFTVPDEHSPEFLASEEFLKERIKNVLRTLSFREREILNLRYGLEEGYSYTIEEVAHIFKVTRERIRQIEAKAIRKLQQPSRSQQLVGFLDDC